MAAGGGPYLSVQRYLGLGKEATRGTVAAAFTYLPVDQSPEMTPGVGEVNDMGLRGSPGEQYDWIPTTRHEQYVAKGNVFCDTFPLVMKGLLGGTDTVTGTVAPYTHLIKLLNAVTTGSQPPSYSINDYDLIEQAAGADAMKQMLAGQLVQVDVNYTPSGALTWGATWISNPYSEVAAPSGSFSSEVLVPGWNGVVSFGGTQNFVILEGGFTAKRSTEAVFTVQGSQSPYRLWAGPISIEGKFSFIALSAETTIVNGLTRQQQVSVMTFTDPVSSHSVAFTMSAIQFVQPKVQSDKLYVTTSTNFKALMNSTDAASGYAPLQFQAVNALSTAF